MTLHDKLKSLGACKEALEWIKQYDDPQKAWDECERQEWMFWYMYKSGQYLLAETKEICQIQIDKEFGLEGVAFVIQMAFRNQTQFKLLPEYIRSLFPIVRV